MRDVTITLPENVVREARLYACNPHDTDAICHVIEDYGRLVRKIRDLRARTDQLDAEGAEFDRRLEGLQRACRAILDL